MAGSIKRRPKRGAVDVYKRQAYIGSADPRDPLVSPLFADLRGLPPLLLQVGSEEMLRDDNARMAAKAEAAGVSVTFEEWPDMIHVWHMYSDRLHDAREALQRIGAFVNRHSCLLYTSRCV